jgi:hypothetical protein
MPLLFGHDRDVAEWAEQKLDGRMVFPHAAIGMLDQYGTLRGAFLLAFHNAHTAELTLYSEGVITNGHLRGFFRWTFEGLGIHRLQIRTHRKHKAVKRAAPTYGFAFEGVARDFYGPGDDSLNFYMTPAMCRWIRINDGLDVLNSEAAQSAGPIKGRRSAARDQRPERAAAGGV